MPQKFLVEFIADWIRNPELRKRVLYKERTELGEYKLDAYQVTDLLRLTADDIVKRLREELEDGLQIKVDKVRKDIEDNGGWGGGGPPSPGGAGSAYEEGNPHVRGVIPQKIVNKTESVVVVRGHGWNDSLKILFEDPATKNLVGSTRLHLDSDIDVWQRATVSVELKNAGNWRAVARITYTDSGGTEKQADSTEAVQLVVT